MDTTNTIIIGAGQAGLALSRCLTDRHHDHVVIERGRVAERWRTERWSSLRLLTPNWMTRLPEFSYQAYQGDDPDGFMTASEVVDFFTRYANTFTAPILDRTAVEHVGRHGQDFVVTTDRAPLRSHNVVVATGWCDRPAVPAGASQLSHRVQQVVPSRYRSPDDLPAGGVLVVGASATGVQLADEVHRSGRPVTLAVGSHDRMPRRYRGMDTFWWLDQIGAFDRTVDDMSDADGARREPSLQLVGRPDHTTLDLATLRRLGVRLVGRVQAIDGERVTLGDGLGTSIRAADHHMRLVLARIDDAIEGLGLSSEVLAPEPVEVVRPGRSPRSLHLSQEGITSIVWATGFSRSYHWLDLPIFDRRGEIRQRRGVTAVAGAYALGLRFQHFRSSNFIDGVGRDAEFVADHICRRSGPSSPSPSSSPSSSPSIDAHPSIRLRQN